MSIVNTVDSMGFESVFDSLLEWSESSITRCTDLLRKDQHLMDVVFVVGKYEEAPERVPANKALLAEVSEVFRAMFVGPLAMRSSEVDLRSDAGITPESFKEFLRFIYAGKVKLTVESILPILYLSKKYKCRRLTRRCWQFWEPQVELSNVFSLPSDDELQEEFDAMHMNAVDADDPIDFEAIFDSIAWSESSITRCTKVFERSQYALDVVFVVRKTEQASERIAASKELLAEVSDVFRAMFFGPLAMGSEVDLRNDQNITSESFRAFLRFVYAGEVELTVDNVLQILHLSMKYMCDRLTDCCCEFLEPRIDRSNIFSLFQVVGQHEELEMGRLACPYECGRMPSANYTLNDYDSDSDSDGWHGNRSHLYPYA